LRAVYEVGGISTFRLSTFKVTIIVIAICLSFYFSLSSATRPFALFGSQVSQTGPSHFFNGRPHSCNLTINIKFKCADRCQGEKIKICVGDVNLVNYCASVDAVGYHNILLSTGP
jgi:hypothetical protein